MTGQAGMAGVAQVAVDLPLAHLDRPFDYAVPAAMDAHAVPGCRVKVRFAGRDVNGFVVRRIAVSGHPGALAPLRRVVSPEAVLTPQVLDVARMVADRYAGTLADVLRLAVPPRHARTEREPTAPRPLPLTPSRQLLDRAWEAERGGAAWLDRCARGEHPRAVWSAPAGADWAARLAAAAAATRESGRGSLLLVPNGRDIDRLDAALAEIVGAGSYAVLTADLGPTARYRAFLAVLRGTADIVVGTRAAAFAPVRRLGLVAMWDDGDDSYQEPRAPYPHAREVLIIRAFHEQAAMLLGGYSRSVEAQALLATHWAEELSAGRATLRAASAQVHVTGETDADLPRDPAARRTRMPLQVFATVREALESGPVLVHTPRYGYQPALACANCRQPARCTSCAGRLGRRTSGGDPRCRRCGVRYPGWNCPDCGGRALRAPVVGSLRTAEEWGRSFPQVSIVASGRGTVIDELDDRPAIVVATPGAEPRAAGGYTAAVLLDTWLTLAMPGLRAEEEALRRWLAVAALVRPRAAGGRIVAVGDPGQAALQALLRWDPAGFAARELAQRRSARLTPAARMASIVAPDAQLGEALAALALPPGADVLGPVEIGDDLSQVFVRIDAERGATLSRALQRLQAARSARKLPPVRLQVDPPG